MPITLDRVIALLKVPPIKTGFIIFVASSFFLLYVEFNTSKSCSFPISEKDVTYGMYVFFLSAAFLVVSYVFSFFEWLKSKYESFLLINRLKCISQAEKDILNGYLVNNTRTRYAHFSDGSFKSLVNDNVLYTVNPLTDEYQNLTYNIHPWAWNYLNKNPNSLKT